MLHLLCLGPLKASGLQVRSVPGHQCFKYLNPQGFTASVVKGLEGGLVAVPAQAGEAHATEIRFPWEGHRVP